MSKGRAGDGLTHPRHPCANRQPYSVKFVLESRSDFLFAVSVWKQTNKSKHISTSLSLEWVHKNI